MTLLCLVHDLGLMFPSAMEVAAGEYGEDKVRCMINALTDGRCDTFQVSMQTKVRGQIISQFCYRMLITEYLNKVIQSWAEKFCLLSNFFFWG